MIRSAIISPIAAVAALMIGLPRPAAASGTPGSPARASTDSAGIRWTPIPGGSFMMGFGALDGWPWAKPAHRVTVKSFEMARAPVTFKQYKACVAAGACAPAHVADGTCWAYDDHGANWAPRNLPVAFQDDEQPAVCVDWEQAEAFSRWAGGRLPTEAEWEYAARSAGRDYLYPWGDEPSTCERAVIPDVAAGGEGCGRRATWPVCSKPLGDTAQGLCDMSGNVWAWVRDSYHKSYAGAPADGRAWGDPRRRDARDSFAANADGSAWGNPTRFNPVARGGSWRIAPGFDRAAFRFPLVPVYRYSTGGIRPARSRP